MKLYQILTTNVDFLLKELSIFGIACLQQSTFHLYPALRALSVVLTFQNL